MTVRRAVRADIPALAAVMKRHHAEEAYPFPFDAARISISLAAAIESPDWLCITAGSGSVLLASCFESPFGAGRLAVEHLVRSEKPKTFGALLTEYETWARSKGCAFASLGCTSAPERFARLYRRHGYSLSESIFSKAL